jgi:thiol-disulfide isomerase/thioredoxin
MNLAQAVALIRGVAGTTVRLTILPAGADDSQALVVSFARGELSALARWGDGVLLTNGSKAPDIDMIELPNGRLERLASHAGKILVLEFWATWCGPCQPKMAEFQSYSEEHPDWKGRVVLIAASVDESEDAATKHLMMKGWTKSHNVWVGASAIKSYHVEAIPTAYVIDRQGKIVAANPKSIKETVSRQLGEDRPSETKSP